MERLELPDTSTCRRPEGGMPTAHLPAERHGLARQQPPRLQLVVLAALASSGCSLMFVHRPSTPTADTPVASPCTSSRLAPGLDLAVAIGASTAGLAMMVDSAREPTCTGWDCVGTGVGKDVERGGGAVSLGVGVLAFVSAGLGYSWTNQCESAPRHPPPDPHLDALLLEQLAGARPGSSVGKLESKPGPFSDPRAP